MEQFLQNLINALQWGSFYAVISIGYSMVYGVLMLFNFAHGDIFMTGTYIGFGVATLLLAVSGAVLPGWAIFLLTVLLYLAGFASAACIATLGWARLRKEAFHADQPT